MTGDRERGEADDPAALVADLLGLMELERLEVDLFRGPRTHEPWRRVFGGQVVGQALMAACHTVTDRGIACRLPHSLHGYFMRPGNPALPIVYRVIRDRDGGSFSTRRVVALQDGQILLNLACSFQRREEGVRHQFPMPQVRPPEALEDQRVALARLADRMPPERRAFLDIGRPIEFRRAEDLRATELEASKSAYWFRAVATLPDDQVLHRVLLAYASDMMLLMESLRPHGLHWLVDPIQEASLDHAMWLHDDLRLDDWLLYVQDSPWSGNARGLTRGLIYRRDGTLVASVAQEGLIRVLDGRFAPPG